jgi:hypothetical protein
VHCVISGLARGTTYSVSVVATNGAGTSDPSGTQSATTFDTPGAPKLGTLTPSSGQVSVGWSAPASVGGTPITGYTVTATPGGKTCITLTLHCAITALKSSLLYSFSVTATNLVGTGPSSVASSAYPATSAKLSIWAAPKIVRAGSAFSFGVIGGTPGATVHLNLKHAAPTSCIVASSRQCTITTSEPTPGVFKLGVASGASTSTKALYVPSVTAPSAAKAGGTISVTLHNCPSGAVVNLKTSDGRTFKGTASALGIAHFSVKLKVKGTLTLTVSVAGVVVAVKPVTAS